VKSVKKKFNWFLKFTFLNKKFFFYRQNRIFYEVLIFLFAQKCRHKISIANTLQIQSKGFRRFRSSDSTMNSLGIHDAMSAKAIRNPTDRRCEKSSEFSASQHESKKLNSTPASTHPSSPSLAHCLSSRRTSLTHTI
jgi:hypothetical protein